MLKRGGVKLLAACALDLHVIALALYGCAVAGGERAFLALRIDPVLLPLVQCLLILTAAVLWLFMHGLDDRPSAAPVRSPTLAGYTRVLTIVLFLSIPLTMHFGHPPTDILFLLLSLGFLLELQYFWGRVTL